MKVFKLYARNHRHQYTSYYIPFNGEHSKKEFTSFEKKTLRRQQHFLVTNLVIKAETEPHRDNSVRILKLRVIFSLTLVGQLHILMTNFIGKGRMAI